MWEMVHNKHHNVQCACTPPKSTDRLAMGRAMMRP